MRERSGAIVAALLLVVAWMPTRPGLLAAGPDPLAPWRDALASPQPARRVEAAKAIAASHGPPEEVVPALVDLLEDENLDVRCAAAGGLGQLGPAAAGAVPALIAAMATDEHDSSHRAVWAVIGRAVARIGPPALPELVRALGSDDPRLYSGAAVAIHEMGPQASGAVDALAEMLSSDSHRKRGAAIHAIQGIGPAATGAVEALRRSLGHEDFHTRYWACQALGAIGPGAQPATGDLLRAIRQDGASVRRHAAAALGAIGAKIGPDAVEQLIDTMSNDPSQPVREDAVIALGKLKPFAAKTAPAIANALAAKRIAARVAAARSHWLLTGRTDVAMPVLIEQLGNVLGVFDAAAVLGEIGPPAAPQAVDPLAALLDSDDADVRLAAAAALGKLGPQARRADKRLRGLLEDEDPQVRQAAAESLKSLGLSAPADH